MRIASSLTFQVFFLMIFFFSTLSLHAAVVPDSVGVLDFEMANENEKVDNWAIGLADFLSLRLQESGIQIYERQFLQYIFAEHRLSEAGLLKPVDVFKHKLPWVNYLIKGSIQKQNEKEFHLEVSLISAKTGIETAGFMEQGKYPDDINEKINLVADKIADKISTKSKDTVAAVSPFGFSKTPEVVLMYYKGIAHCMKGRPEYGAAYFMEVLKIDPDFIAAHACLLKSFEMLGIEEYIEITDRSINKRKEIAQPIINIKKIPTVLLYADHPDDGTAMQFYKNMRDALSKNADIRVLSPKYFQDLVAESDLSLSGVFDGSSPLSTMEWLHADTVIDLNFVYNDQKLIIVKINLWDIRTQKIADRIELPISDKSCCSNLDAIVRKILSAIVNAAHSPKDRHSKTVYDPERYQPLSNYDSGGGIFIIDDFARYLYLSLSGDISVRRDATLLLTNYRWGEEFRVATYKRLLKDIDKKERNAADLFSTALWAIYDYQYGESFCFPRDRKEGRKYKSIADHFKILLDAYPDSVASIVLKYPIAYEYLVNGDIHKAADVFSSLAGNIDADTPFIKNSRQHGEYFLCSTYFFAAYTAYKTNRHDMAKQYIEKAKALSDKIYIYHLDCYCSYGYGGRYKAEHLGLGGGRIIECSTSKFCSNDIKTDIINLYRLLVKQTETLKDEITLISGKILSARGNQRILLYRSYIENFVEYYKDNAIEMELESYQFFCEKVNELIAVSENEQQANQIRSIVTPLISHLSYDQLIDLYLYMGQYEKAEELARKENIDIDDKILPIVSSPEDYGTYLYNKFMEDYKMGHVNRSDGLTIAHRCSETQQFDHAYEIYRILLEEELFDEYWKIQYKFHIARVEMLRGNLYKSSEIFREIARQNEGKNLYVDNLEGSANVHEQSLNYLKVLRLFPDSKFSNQWLNNKEILRGVNLHGDFIIYVDPNRFENTDEMKQNFNMVISLTSLDGTIGEELNPFIKQYQNDTIAWVIDRFNNPVLRNEHQRLIYILKRTHNRDHAQNILDIFKKFPRVVEIAFAYDPATARKIMHDRLPFMSLGNEIPEELASVIEKYRLEEYYELLFWHISKDCFYPLKKIDMFDRLISKDMLSDSYVKSFRNALSCCIRNKLNQNHSDLNPISRIAVKNGVADGIIGLLYKNTFRPGSDLAYLRKYIDLPTGEEAAEKFLRKNMKAFVWEEKRHQFVIQSK
ncbi:MAG: hypothetical protein C0403_03490 [Desulfobacterium sp.]|nr:hypothetical protein [Desulfobacterium sp.]